MMRAVWIFIFVFSLAFPVSASAGSKLVIDLAKDHIDITTGFNGASVYVHGYIDTETGQDDPSSYDLVVVIKGPTRNTIVRRKEQIFGMWMNRMSVTFKDVYSFYDLASTDLLDRIASVETLEKHAIGLDFLSFDPKEAEIDQAALLTFQEALIRTKQSQALYALSPRSIDFISGPFFKTIFLLPPSVPTGEYSVEAYLFEGQDIIDKQSLTLTIAQVGVNAEIFQFARDNAFLYGLSAILLALVFGWSAHAFLRQD